MGTRQGGGVNLSGSSPTEVKLCIFMQIFSWEVIIGFDRPEPKVSVVPVWLKLSAGKEGETKKIIERIGVSVFN